MLLLALCFLTVASAAHLPASVKTCKQSDANFNECAKINAEEAIKQFAAGSKELGLNPLEPLSVTEMGAPGSGNVNVEQNYKNIQVFGLTGSKIETFKIDVPKCQIDFTSFSPRINVIADYTLKGQMSVFPINSQGKSNQTIENLKLTHKMVCEKYEKKGKTYIKIVDYKSTFDDYNVHLDFDNLVSGNDELSKELRQVMAENSNSIFKETKPAYEISYAELFKQLANQVFSRVPMEELFPK